MNDEDETKEQLINEVKHLPQRITELKTLKTGRKRAEEVLRESESGYKELADFLPQPVFEMDERGDLTFANRNAFEAFGYTQEDFIKGVNAINMVIPEDRDRAQNNMQRILSGEKLGGNEYRVLRKDGSTFPVIIHSAPIIHEGKAVGLRGIMIDITGRKQAEEELKKSEERYKSLVEDINDGYFIIQDEKFVYINQAFADLSGYTKEGMLGMEFVRLFPQEYLERLSKDILKRKEDREHVVQNEFEISRKDEENLVLEIRSRVIDYHGRSAIAGICKNITERKKAEIALKEKVEELEKWYQLTVDREIKMTQLKNRIQELESKGRRKRK